MKLFDKLEVKVWGESHASAIGGSVSGLPSGYFIDLNKLKEFLARRKSADFFTTPRLEDDEFSVKGLNDGKTSSIISFEIKNKNVRPNDYTSTVPRPSHADYPCFVKYGYIPTGGGKYSGRMTAPLTLLGGVAKQILEAKGISISARILKIGGLLCSGGNISDEILKKLKSAQLYGDSLGGVVACKVCGMPIGIGDNLFEGLESKIAAAIYAIPAVKGVEFGLGFKLSDMFGSEANDQFEIDNGKIKLKTNNAGGINGGITNGNPIEFNVAFRPTPSIKKAQDSVDLKEKKNVKLEISGRHDICFVPRAVVVVEAVCALAILDSII